MARRRRAAEEIRRRGRRLNAWQKAIWLVFICIVLFAGFCIIRKTYRPFGLALHGKQEVKSLEAELAAKNREKQANLDKRRYLRSPEGSETEARKLGYVKPGETSVMVEQEKKKENDRK